MADRKRTNGKYHQWITNEGLIKLEGWAKSGLVDHQISKNIGIDPATLYTWKKRFPEIEEALRRGKEVVDFEVENALLRRALGYEYEEVKQIVEVAGEKNTGRERKRVEKTIKKVIPDTTACIFWLKNRKPEEWRDRPAEVKVDTDSLELLIKGLVDG